MTIDLSAERHWTCPNCAVTAVTRGPETNRLHTCRGLFGLSVPMVLDGTRCKITAVERGDWVGKERVQLDGRRRPVMSVVTTRDDGQDCRVFAPAASVNGKSRG